MKKLILLAAIVTTAAVVGFHQNARLKSLIRTESASIATDGTQSRFGRNRSATGPPAAPATLNLTDSASLEIRSLIREGVALGTHPESAAARAESYNRFITAIASLNHLDAMKLLADCQEDLSLPEILRQNSHAFISSWMESANVNPKETFLFIKKLADYPARQHRLNSAFKIWAMVEPEAAKQWLDLNSDEIGDDRTTRTMRNSLAQAFAASHPDRAIEQAIAGISREAGSENHQGAAMAATLRSLGEHRTFIAALERAEKSADDPRTIHEIRQSYVRGTSADLYQWPFEEATSLIDLEFRPEEKAIAMEQISIQDNLADREQWVTWISKTDIPINSKHPLHRFIISWARSEPAAAGRWLEQVACDDLRNQIIANRRTRKGWAYLSMVGEQRNWPFEPLHSSSGGAGWSFRAGDQNFTAPKDGYSYMAVPYQNEDGSVFMEIFRSEEPNKMMGGARGK